MTSTMTKTAAADNLALLPAQITVQPKLLSIIDEINAVALEREDVTWAMTLALISRQHLLMVGPGGTAKSMVARMLAQRITDAKYFETTLDETTTPDEVFGSPDIPLMVETGRTRRVVANMLPEADLAFLDEFFNANGPVLHKSMPILNERMFHNGDQIIHCPLRTVVAGTNKLNADADQAALWDRIHIRVQVSYLGDRDAQANMLTAAIRRAVRGDQTSVTTVTLAELDAAHDEAFSLPVSDTVLTTYLDLLARLKREGIEVGDRRKVEGLKAVMANAWLSGHSEVRTGDLGILQHMFWLNMDQHSKVRGLVLDACNPAEKAAIALLDDLNELAVKYSETTKLDKTKRSAASVDLFKRAGKVLDEAAPLRQKAMAGGASTLRIDELIKQAAALKVKIGTEAFGLPEHEITKLDNTRRR